MSETDEQLDNTMESSFSNMSIDKSGNLSNSSNLLANSKYNNLDNSEAMDSSIHQEKEMFEKVANSSADANKVDPNGYEIIEKILAACKPDLSSFLQRFKDAMIVNSSIPHLSSQTIDLLFPKELGYRDILKKAIHEQNLKDKKGKNDVSYRELDAPEDYRPFCTWKKKVSVRK